MEEMTTEDILAIVAEPNHMLWPGAMEELLARVIKENDDDDTPQHRGGIRPNHAPLV